MVKGLFCWMEWRWFMGRISLIARPIFNSKG
jgi:hypothetical protein